MSAFWQLLKKELRELARPQYIVPLLLMPLFFVLVIQGGGAAEEAAAQKPVVAVVDNDGGAYAGIANETLRQRANVTAYETSLTRQQSVELLEGGPARLLFVFPENFSDRIGSGQQADVRIYSSLQQVSVTSGTQSAKADALLGAIDENITTNVTGASPAALHPTTSSHTTFVQGTQVEASPGALSGSVGQRFFFLGFVISLAVFGAGTLVVNSMGSEKENGTLETLLTLPVQRRTIVGAKLGASAILSAGLAGFYIGVLYLVRDSGGAAIAQLSGLDYALVGVSLLLAIVDMLALALCLGVFANDSRGAQSLLMPLSFLMLAPPMIVNFFDVSSMALPLQAAFYAIPSTHPVIAPMELAFGGTTTVLAGIAYEIVFAAVVIGITVRLFGSDRLITGDAGRLNVVFDALQD